MAVMTTARREAERLVAAALAAASFAATNLAGGSRRCPRRHRDPR